MITPPQMAAQQRQREGHSTERDQLIGYADAELRYTSITLAERLELQGRRTLIGTVADTFDNTLIETLLGLSKIECIGITVFHAESYSTIAEIE